LDGLNLTGTFPVASSFTPSPLLTADYLKMVVGTLATDKYTATINLLQTYGDTKILSRPRLSVVSNTEAKILVGSREAYVTQSQSQATSTTVTSESVSFIDVGVKINVVPTINKDGFITMKIKPEVSSVRETLTTALGSKVPIVETSEAETVVKVKDGQMIMIAGLIKDDKRNDKSGIPILCNLPLLGTLFSTTSTLKKRTELVIFIRPRIISGVGMIPGAEPEKIIPTDIMPKDMKEPIANRIISNRIDEIKEMEPKSKAAPEKFVFSEDRIRQIKKSGKPAASPDMVYELKGVKSGVILSEAKDLKKDSSPRQGGAQNDKVSAPQLEDTGPTDNTESISGKMKGIKKY
jgi:Flp pilus assembly secretin CpaC